MPRSFVAVNSAPISELAQTGLTVLRLGRNWRAASLCPEVSNQSPVQS